MPHIVIDVAILERWLREFAHQIRAHKDLLTALDAAIGDADHGTNLDRGLTAVEAALAEAPPPDAAALLKSVAMTLISTIGGASGPLYGTLFWRMATTAGDGPLDGPAFATALRAGLDGVVARGRATAGDKTMYDALLPACDALEAALADGTDLDTAVRAAAQAADAGRDATISMTARKGRASYLGERSIGHQDPGATSSALLVTALATVLDGDQHGDRSDGARPA